MKKILQLLFMICAIGMNAQTFENQWAALFSFSNVVDLAEGNDKLYAASENAVFTYDLITSEINTITTIQGLSGELISSINYSEGFNITAIGYQNGLIELILDDGTVLKVIDILDKPTIPPNRKRINHFNEFNGNLYISTDFGISVYDLTSLEFGDSYFIGDLGTQTRINQTAILDGYIFAAMGNKIKRADVNNPNLINFEEWFDYYPSGMIGIQSFGDFLYGIDFNSRLLQFEDGNATIIANFSEPNKNIYTSENYLTVTSETSSTVFDLSLDQVASVNSVMDYEEYGLSNSLAYNNNIYLATDQYGVLEVPFGNNQAEQILPDGPILNKPFAIDATPGQLWVVFGEVTLTFNPFPLNERGMSQFINNKWVNVAYEELFGAKSISYVKIDPNNPSEVYAGSMNDGLLKLVDSIPTILFDETNSALEPGFVTSNNPGGSIRIFGSEFDNSGNLWFVQSGVENGLNKLSASGQIQGYDLTSVIPDPPSEVGLNKLDITREGFVFFASLNNGLIGYNPTTGAFKKIMEDFGNGNLPDKNVRAVTIDNRNQAWIGTLRGLRVLFNVGGFFQENANVDAQPIIILDDDGVPQELLFEQSITDIEVDGANNKWIATATSGVFYVSSNGQETLLRFNKDNSPLPSNNVQDIAIDPQSGVVYFATANGLMAFNGTTTAPNESLEALRAFPNPVRPNFNGSVTIDGLTARANVKITDVNGNLVYEQVSEGGSLQWDTTAFGRYKVSSGVYFIMATTDDAMETKVAKVMIVR